MNFANKNPPHGTKNNNGVGFTPCRGWQSTAEGMKLGQDLQSPTPDSSQKQICSTVPPSF